MTPGNFSSPIEKSMPIAQLTKNTITTVNPLISQKGEEMSTLEQAPPPQYIVVFIVVFVIVLFLVRRVGRHPQAKQGFAAADPAPAPEYF